MLNRRLGLLRILLTSLLGLSVPMLVGCSNSRKSEVSLTNVSDAWFDVTFFVEATTQEGAASHRRLIGDTDLQIRPGETRSYALKRHPAYDERTRPLVHFRVRPVMPSWEESTTEYWMELLTLPPVTIVATGTARRIEFMTGDGALARIPDPHGTRFVYEIPGDGAVVPATELATAEDVDRDGGEAGDSKP